MRAWLCCLITLGICLGITAQEVFTNIYPEIPLGDYATKVVTGSSRTHARETNTMVGERQSYWRRDFSSAEAYAKSVGPNRERLRKLIGAIDSRLAVTALETNSSMISRAKAGETSTFTVEEVRWPVFEGVHGEGLWLQTKGQPVAYVVVIPDADQTPEMLVGLAPGVASERQMARRLAENGCEVLVPVLIDRQDTSATNSETGHSPNPSHREWIYRQASPLGRHIIGYEVQKVLAAVDFFESKRQQAEGRNAKIGVAGYGEGGLMTLYAAALDQRIEGALVSGYFDSRQRLGEEPIYRNVFGLLREFGDAEIGSLVAPNALIIEYSAVPMVDGPPMLREGQMGTAPRKLQTPEYDAVEAEFERARTLLEAGNPAQFNRLKLITGTEGMTTGPGSDRALTALLNGLGVSIPQLKEAGPAPAEWRRGFEMQARQQRQVKELEDYTQRLLGEGERARPDVGDNKIKGPAIPNSESRSSKSETNSPSQ